RPVRASRSLPGCFCLRCPLPQPSRLRTLRYAWLSSSGSSLALRPVANGRYGRRGGDPQWRGPMLDLPSVTLCCVDTANPELALRALARSTTGIRFARVLLLTERTSQASGIEV